MKTFPLPSTVPEKGEQCLITRDTLTTLRVHEATGDLTGADSVERWGGLLIDVDPGGKGKEEGDADHSFETFSCNGEQRNGEVAGGRGRDQGRGLLREKKTQHVYIRMEGKLMHGGWVMTGTESFRKLEGMGPSEAGI